MAQQDDDPVGIGQRHGREPEPEMGPAMRALPPRWQRAVLNLFLNGGEKNCRSEGGRIQRHVSERSKGGCPPAVCG
jgi:hypothetical protein